MANLYIFNFSVKSLATKKVEQASVIAPSFNETKDILFKRFGSNYSDRCRLTSVHPYKEEEVK